MVKSRSVAGVCAVAGILPTVGNPGCPEPGLPTVGNSGQQLVTPGVGNPGGLLLLLLHNRGCQRPGYRTYTRNRPGYTREYTVPK